MQYRLLPQPLCSSLRSLCPCRSPALHPGPKTKQAQLPLPNLILALPAGLPCLAAPSPPPFLLIGCSASVCCRPFPSFFRSPPLSALHQASSRTSAAKTSISSKPSVRQALCAPSPSLSSSPACLAPRLPFPLLLILTSCRAGVPNLCEKDENGHDVRDIAREAENVHHGAG